MYQPVNHKRKLDKFDPEILLDSDVTEKSLAGEQHASNNNALLHRGVEVALHPHQRRGDVVTRADGTAPHSVAVLHVPNEFEQTIYKDLNQNLR